MQKILWNNFSEQLKVGLDALLLFAVIATFTVCWRQEIERQHSVLLFIKWARIIEVQELFEGLTRIFCPSLL